MDTIIAPAPAQEIRASIEELRGMREFQDLQNDDLAWLADHGRVMELEAGDALFRTGDPADTMIGVLDGEIHSRSETGSQSRVFIARRGDVSGKLPFSRMMKWAGTGRAAVRSRVWLLTEDQFSEMLRAIPILEQRLVTLMVERVRQVTRTDEQSERLLALGKLSAGLAHELNNPAAAARRSAQTLRESLDTLRDATLEFVDDPEMRGDIMTLLQSPGCDAPAGELARSEREEGLALWMEERGVASAWQVAGPLAASGLDAEALDGCDLPPAAYVWLGALLSADALLREIEEASTRISGLVAAVKSYSHMDGGRAKVPTDVHAGLESTLTMLAHRFRACGCEVVREYMENLPAVTAHPGELNQVWTNLLDNAIDAVTRNEGVVTVRTALKAGTHVLVEIADNGAGIAPELLPRIWEPFFSTKPVGEGTGLGLDVVYSLVTQGHGGSIDVRSAPGDTCFQIMLPIRPAFAADPEGDEASRMM